MDNIIYSKTLRIAKDSPDGETPLRLLVTQEVNAVIVWLDGVSDSEQPMVPLRVYSNYRKNEAIEDGVRLAKLDLAALERRAIDIQEYV